MDKFDQKGIQKLNNVYEDDIKTLKTRLEKLTDMSKDYTNFSGISKGMDGKVKFVIETAEVLYRLPYEAYCFLFSIYWHH